MPRRWRERPYARVLYMAIASWSKPEFFYNVLNFPFPLFSPILQVLSLAVAKKESSPKETVGFGKDLEGTGIPPRLS